MATILQTKWKYNGLGKNLSKIISVFSQNTIHQNLKTSPEVLQIGKAKEGHKHYLNLPMLKELTGSSN